jgi:hypothetical protein
MSQHDGSTKISVEPNILPHYDHIPLHRLWVFMSLQVELRPPEILHVLNCKECRVSLRACVHADTFGAVLEELRKEANGSA